MIYTQSQCAYLLLHHDALEFRFIINIMYMAVCSLLVQRWLVILIGRKYAHYILMLTTGRIPAEIDADYRSYIEN